MGVSKGPSPCHARRRKRIFMHFLSLLGVWKEYTEISRHMLNHEVLWRFLSFDVYAVVAYN